MGKVNLILIILACYTLQQMESFACKKLCVFDGDNSGYYDIKTKSCVCAVIKDFKRDIEVRPPIVESYITPAPKSEEGGFYYRPHGD